MPIIAVRATTQAALTNLPLVVLGSVALVALARYEANPIRIIKRLKNNRLWAKTFRSYGESLGKMEADLKATDNIPVGDAPTHEWRRKPIPAPEYQIPFFQIGSIGRTATKDGDSIAQIWAVSVLLEALETFWNKFDQELPAETTILVTSQLELMAESAAEFDKSGFLLARILDQCELYLNRQLQKDWPSANSVSYVLGYSVDVGKKLITRGYADEAKISLISIRRFAQRGLYRISESNDEPLAHMNSAFFDHTLSNISYKMRSLGSEAIKMGDSEFLFRVLESFGWLGCSAIKLKVHYTATACARALSQLGREAKAANLSCHWDKCALLPNQHAEERLDWMLGCVEIDDKAEAWTGFLSSAYSRLLGINLTISKTTDSAGKARWLKTVGAAPWQQTYYQGSHSMVVDYSDPTMLRDLELY
jgi:hypothetical protein